MMMMLPVSKGLFAQASPGEIHGKILEKKDVPYPGNAIVWVEITGGVLKTGIDEQGRFILKPLDPGTYQLNVLIESDTFKISTPVIANEITRRDIDLSKPEFASTEIGPFDVIYFKDLIRVDNASMDYMDAKQLAHSPAKRDIKQIVATMGGGVRVTESGDAYVRGSRADAINYYIDGMRLRDGFKSPPSSAIASVAVFTGGVPAKYGDCTGGVVVVETKSYLNLYQEWLMTQE